MKKKAIFVTVIMAGIVFMGGSAGFPGGVPDAGKAAESANAFGFDLYHDISQGKGNVFFSPYSVFTALAMTCEGAKGTTARQMEDVLHLPEDRETLRTGLADIRGRLHRDTDAYELHTANALWVEKEYPFVDAYFRVIEAYYDGSATPLDFRTGWQNARKTINRWVEKKTRDRIKDLIPSGALSAMTRLVLTNAVYFKAKWALQFDPAGTREGKFTLQSGKKVDTPMMHRTGSYRYGETETCQMLEMDYRGNDLSMLILLPREDKLEETERLLENEVLTERIADMQQEKVKVSLPKFTLETKYFLSKTLREMGMTEAFQSGEADFTGISPTDELYIDAVIHQAFVEVAEYGTEAAAATAVVVVAKSAPAKERPRIFNADHPFIFMIREKTTGHILFMGRVMHPGG